MKSHDLSYSKANFLTLKKERDMLKITLKCITEENEQLKNELNDMRVTAKKNKDMLKEYVNQITNKDKLFEKMSSTIEQLKNRLKVLEQSKREKVKELKRYDLKVLNTNGNIRLGDYTQSIPNNHSTTTTSNNFTMNNIISSCGGESMNNGFNILNNNINRLGKGKHGLNTVNNAKLNKSMSNFNDINKGFNILNNSNKNNANANKYKNDEIIESEENKNKASNNNNEDNNNSNKKENIKSLMEKQSYIMEEILNIKDDIQFIMENKNKSKLRDKLNQSLVCSDSLNSSFYSERNNNEQNKNQNQNMNTSFSSENNQDKAIDNSYISQNISNLSVSYYGTDQNILRHLNYTMNTSNANYNNNYNNENNHKNSKKRKNYNLKERYVIDENFSSFIDKTNIKKEILFLIDGKENVWEIIKRGDLNSNQLRKYGKDKENKIKSVLSLIKGDNNQGVLEMISGNNKNEDKKDMDFFYTDLIDIEIKDPTDNIFK